VNEHVAAYPDSIAPAVAAYEAMDEEQRNQAHELHELGCTGHSLNLTTDRFERSKRVHLLSLLLLCSMKFLHLKFSCLVTRLNYLLSALETKVLGQV
jgi:hypothetical protein